MEGRKKPALLQQNFAEFHTNLDELLEQALEIEHILTDFMAPNTIEKLKDAESHDGLNELILAALDQRQCARSIVFRGLVFLGYTSELLQSAESDWFEGRRLARNPEEMYNFYAAVIFPDDPSEVNDMPAITSQRPVGVRQAFLKNLLEDSAWVDNVIYDLRETSWRDDNTFAENAPDGTAVKTAAVMVKEIRDRRANINIDHRSGLNAARNGKTPVYLEPEIFAELTFNFVENNVAKFVDKIFLDYKDVIYPTLQFSIDDVNAWNDFLLNVWENYETCLHAFDIQNKKGQWSVGICLWFLCAEIRASLVTSLHLFHFQ